MSSTCAGCEARKRRPPTATVLAALGLLALACQLARETAARPATRGPSATSAGHTNDQDERLLAGLNESLSRYLQADSSATAAAARAAASNTSRSQQQQIVALKKISCDKLSLLVMAQKVLNVNASSGALHRLAECRQENLLDLELIEMFERSAGRQAPPSPASLASESAAANQTRAGPRQQSRDRATVRRPSECGPGQDKAGGCAPHAHRLHPGALLVIGLLVVGLTLVGFATVVDYRAPAARTSSAKSESEADEEAAERQTADSRHAANSRFFLDLGPQMSKMRDYRSLSISSNCSSNLFCSTNSVASSSTPILTNSQPLKHHACCSPANQNQHQQPGQACNQYESNLHLHLSQAYEPQQSGLDRTGSSACESSCDARKSSAGKTLRASSGLPAQEEFLSRAFLRQILLAFSLRRTLGQIFEQQSRKPTASVKQPESVDSLHGLRFFSMIWVIIIHSYNFALRWMFFSDTSTLDEIYKSTASQFIANGSFACDSFFFVGGFLLPYLALKPAPARKSPSGSDSNSGLASSRQDKQQVVAVHQDEEESAPAGRQPCAPTTSHEQQQQQQHVRATAISGLCVLEECPDSATGAYYRPVDVYFCQAAAKSHSPSSLAQTEAAPEQANSAFAAAMLSCTCEQSANSQAKRRLALHTNEQLVAHRQFAGEHVHSQGGGQHSREDLSQEKGAAESQFTWQRCLANVFRRYVRMMPLMMAIIGLCTSLLRYFGEGPVWQESTMMYDEWCRRNWWVNAMFLHNFVNRQNMCLSHSWYSAVDFQLFLVGQLILFVIYRSRRAGLALLFGFLLAAPLVTMGLTLRHHLPAVPLIASVDEQTMNLYYGEVYIKPYSRAAPYLIGILLAYFMRTTGLAKRRLPRWQVAAGWTAAVSLLLGIILAMQPAMNGQPLGELQSALYSGWSRPLWACATGWVIFACITKQAGPVGRLLGARCFVPLSRLTYPAFLIHPIIMASFYGTRQASFQFSHYLMLYLILGNIVITYASALVLAALIELPFLSIERLVSRRLFSGAGGR